MEDHLNDTTLADAANQAQQRLLALVQAIARTHYAGAMPTGAPVNLSVRLRLDPDAAWKPTADHVPLYRQLSAAFDEICADTDAFQPGRVYCHRLHSAHAAEAIPPSATSVFSGYTSTGMPEWKEFHQFVLDAGDERVHALFTTPPGVIAITTPGRVLKSQMVSTMGKSSRSYNILGQVAAGYYIPDVDGMRDKLAVTLQVVECRTIDGRFRLELNVIGTTPNGDPVADLVANQDLPAVYRAAQAGKRELQKIERAVRALDADAPSDTRNALLGRVPSVLSRIAEMLEHARRQAVRRTKHAETRKGQKRPVQCALEDVARATDAGFFLDDVNATVVVRGPRNRAHVFSPDGRHVTTFTVRSDQVETRLRTKYWQHAPAEEIARFRVALAQRAGEEGE